MSYRIWQNCQLLQGCEGLKKHALYCLVTLVNVPVETRHPSSHAFAELIGHVHIGHTWIPCRASVIRVLYFIIGWDVSRSKCLKMLKIKSQYLFYCGIFKFPDNIFVVSSEILSQLTRSVPMQVVSERENLLLIFLFGWIIPLTWSPHNLLSYHSKQHTETMKQKTQEYLLSQALPQ